MVRVITYVDTPNTVNQSVVCRPLGERDVLGQSYESVAFGGSLHLGSTVYQRYAPLRRAGAVAPETSLLRTAHRVRPGWRCIP
jgi:hypothetical protein